MFEKLNIFLNLTFLIDERVKDFFLMSNPIPGICLLALYLYFVKVIGPKIMKNRPGLNIDGLMKIYNLAQVFLCATLFVQGYKYSFGSGYNIFCEAVDYSNSFKGIMVYFSMM